MAATTYTSPVLNTAAKQIRAMEDVAILAQHLADAVRAGAGDYVGISFTSATVTLGILTVVLTNPLPARQLARFSWT